MSIDISCQTSYREDSSKELRLEERSLRIPILCDEPTGALDYNTSREILKLIEQINQTYGNTIIIVTHNDAIKNMADRVITLRDGQVRKNYKNEHKISANDLEW